MKAPWKTWLAALLVLASLPGLARLRLDTDVTGILPQDLPVVRGLQVMQREFSREGELVILLEADDADDAQLLPDLARELAAHLEASGLVRNARWQAMWDDADAAANAAEWIAWLWWNGEPEVAAAWAGRFADENLATSLDAALAAVATAPEGAVMMMRANDPFGFLRHPSVRFLEDISDGDGFTSEDGLAHLILAENPGELTGYRVAGEWLDAVRATTQTWLAENRDGARVTTRFTGEPAFASEIGRAMERDMRGTAMITMGLVGLLFWWMQRRLRLLAGLVVMLALVFTTTLGVAGWLLGELSVMTAGFAAILIGLAVDYGVLMCQEAKRAPGDAAALRRATTRSILWAAVTTAAVFAALNFSALPGIAALGTLVAVGIGCGAVLMLVFYLPFVAKAGGGRKIAADRGLPMPLRFRNAVVAGVLLAAAALGVLGWCGLPESRFDPAMMRPRESPAMEAFTRVQQGFPAAREPDARWIVTLAPGEDSPSTRLASLAEKADAHPQVAAARVPHGWWPDPSHQRANRAVLARVPARAAQILDAAGRTGFSDDGLALSRAVFREFGRLADMDAALIFPDSPEFLVISRGFMSRNPDGGGAIMIGLALEPEGGTDDGLDDLNDANAHVTGWELLRPALMPLVAADVRRVFVPMLFVMFAMLCIVFRNVRDVVAVTAAMVLAGGMLLAAMAALGIGWNILNIAAAPLFLGIGIDYGIHMGMALRRHRGDTIAAWHGTGKAVVFCAASTSIGFGTLCFASNDALASLGAVSVLGIICAMITSVFLMPGWHGSTPGWHGSTPKRGLEPLDE